MAMPGVALKGKKLEAARFAKRLSTTELAEQVGCSAGHIRLMERGLKRPSVELLGRLETALGVTADQLGAKIPARNP
jgi:transcriptional regulator with XRE-family HTH domain